MRVKMYDWLLHLALSAVVFKAHFLYVGNPALNNYTGIAYFYIHFHNFVTQTFVY